MAFQCLLCKLYFSMFLQNFFNSRCYQVISSLSFLYNSSSCILLVCEAQQIGPATNYRRWMLVDELFQHLVILTLPPSFNVAFSLVRVYGICSHFLSGKLVSFSILNMTFYNKDMLRPNTTKPCAQTNYLKIQ